MDITMTVNIHDAKTRLSQLLIAVEQGEEVIIARNGNPVATLVPFAPKAPMQFELLDVSLKHLAVLQELSWHHRDQFDRMIIA